MTKKEQALEQAVKDALKCYENYYWNGVKLKVIKISEIHFSNCVLFPSGEIDKSNLEECTGGQFDVSLKVECEVNTNGIISEEELFRAESVEFEVEKYEDGKFTIQITNERINLIPERR